MSQTRKEAMCVCSESSWAQAQAAVTRDKYLSKSSLLGLEVHTKAKAMSAHGKQENDLPSHALFVELQTGAERLETTQMDNHALRDSQRLHVNILT